VVSWFKGFRLPALAILTLIFFLLPATANSGTHLNLMTFKASSVTLPDLYEASIAELQDGLVKGHFTSVQLVKVDSCSSGTYLMQYLISHRLTLTESRRST
jgi:hypothetical protein